MNRNASQYSQLSLAEDAQLSLLVDEAIATFTARNRLREVITTKLMDMISKGKIPKKQLELFERLTSVDEFTRTVLNKFTERS